MLTGLVVAVCIAVATLGERSARDREPGMDEGASPRSEGEGVEQFAGELALALAAGCRPVEALSRCSKHRHSGAAGRAAQVVLRIGRGLDPLAALQAPIELGAGQHESALYAALRNELTSGISAAPAVAAVARSSSREARAKEADKAARAAPLVQLIVALALVPSALLIGAALVVAGLGS